MGATDGEGGYMAFDSERESCSSNPESWESVSFASPCEASLVAALDAASGTSSPSTDVREGHRARPGSRVRKLRNV